ncbi:antioxidant, AhpC/TSA family domain protein, partial [Bacteroides fragilis str. S13 L11]
METTTVYPIIKENTFYLIFGAEVVDTVLNHFLRWKSYPICGK